MMTYFPIKMPSTISVRSGASVDMLVDDDAGGRDEEEDGGEEETR